MTVERSGQAIGVEASKGQLATGGTRGFGRRAAALQRWHEPDESRGSSPDLRGARGEIPRAYSACWSIDSGLLVPNRVERIQHRCLAGRNPAGEQSDRGQQQADGNQYHRV